MGARDELDFGIAAGEEDPTAEAVPNGEIEKSVDGTLAVWPRPREAADNVAGIARDGMIVGDEPDGNAAAAETASNSETPMRPTQDHGTLRAFGVLRPGSPSHANTPTTAAQRDVLRQSGARGQPTQGSGRRDARPSPLQYCGR